MDLALAFLTPEVLVAFAVGVVAAWAAGLVPKLVRNVLLWPFRRIGQAFKHFAEHAPIITKAQKEPLAASVYVAYQLTLVVVFVGLGLICAEVLGLYQVIDPAWHSTLHRWVGGLAAFALLVCAFRIFKYYALLVLVYHAVFMPPKPGDTLKLGNKSKPLIEIPLTQASPKPPTNVTPPEAPKPETPPDA